MEVWFWFLIVMPVKLAWLVLHGPVRGTDEPEILDQCGIREVK